MKTLVGIIGWLIIIAILILFRFGCANKDTPEVTDIKKETIRSSSLASDPTYWFVEYMLCDSNRECYPFGREIFCTFKKDDDHIDRNDMCLHCNREWKWHYNK